MVEQANEEDYDRASPITHDLRDFPLCLLIHGVKDKAIPVSNSVGFHDGLT